MLTIGQLGLMPTSTPADRPDWYWGALSSAIGATVIVLNRTEALDEAATFHQLAKAATADQVCTLVATGELRLRNGAERQAFSTRWYAHLANVFFNVGFGLLYWLGYGHVRTAIINTAVGTAIGEGIVLTQPTGLVSAWDQYRQGNTVQPKVSFSIFPTGLGVGASLRF